MQNKMKSDLTDALNAIDETKEIGQASLETLFQQTAQMDAISIIYFNIK